MINMKRELENFAYTHNIIALWYTELPSGKYILVGYDVEKNPFYLNCIKFTKEEIDKSIGKYRGI